MSHYFIAKIKINDETGYQKYLDRAGEVFKKYKGEYLSVENRPFVLEGSWDCTRTILIRFESKQDFEDWYFSEDYQEILKYRLEAAQCDSVLIGGTDVSSSEINP